MAFITFLLKLHPFMLFILISSFCGFVGGLSTYLFRKYGKMKVLRSHNEVTGFFFLAIASFYAFLLSFIVFMVWGQLNQNQSNVSKEGSSAMGLYRDIKFYPDTLESKQLMVLYLDFVFNVIDEEFPNMENKQPSPKTRDSFNRVFYKMENLNPKSQFQIQLVAEMFNHLNQLDTYRGLRAIPEDMEIPPPLWLTIIFGAIITLICAMLLDIEHWQLHIRLNALLGVFIGMILFIIILFDHPYSGSLCIKPQSYKQIFTMEQWYKEIHPQKSNQ